MQNLLRSALYLVLGTLLGIGLLEAIFATNPGLLFRGMALPGPVESPLTRQSYDVHYSDADVFYWRPDLVKPVAPEADLLEAHVELVTDEFGFRNAPPLREKVDVAVVGRSISLAAHLPHPWPDLLAQETGLNVLNLAQPGGALPNKIEQLRRYGLPRHPRWVILEVAPSLEILGGTAPAPTLVQGMVFPMIQGLWKLYGEDKPVSSSGSEIYPLRLDLPARQVDLTCCLHYLEFFSLDRQSLERSADWVQYSRVLLDLNATLKEQSACLVLLYAPTKPDVYFPLATDPRQLEPAVRAVVPYRIEAGGEIVPDPGERMQVDDVRQNAYAGRELIASFAGQNGLLLVDPTEAIVAAVLAGENPFMVYDSHWNSQGHELVARQVAQVLQTNSCP